jgi:hypothetical protein
MAWSGDQDGKFEDLTGLSDEELMERFRKAGEAGDRGTGLDLTGMTGEERNKVLFDSGQAPFPFEEGDEVEWTVDEELYTLDDQDITVPRRTRGKVIKVHYDLVWTTHCRVEITEPVTALVDVGWDTLKLVNPPLVPDYESEAFKAAKDAYENGTRINTTGMTREEFKQALQGPVVITYDDLTPEQRAIVDASNKPGTPVPTGMSREEFTAWYRETIRKRRPGGGET